MWKKKISRNKRYRLESSKSQQDPEIPIITGHGKWQFHRVPLPAPTFYCRGCNWLFPSEYKRRKCPGHTRTMPYCPIQSQIVQQKFYGDMRGHILLFPVSGCLDVYVCAHRSKLTTEKHTRHRTNQMALLCQTKRARQSNDIIHMHVFPVPITVSPLQTFGYLVLH